MGRFARWIDGAALGLILYAAAFGYFYWTTGSVPAGAIIALMPTALAVWAYRRLTKKRFARKERARRARAMAEHLAFLPEAQARAQVSQYAGFTGTLLIRHPKGQPLDANELLSLWRGAEGESLDIATTGAVSDTARAVSEELTAPKVKLLDGRALAARFEKCGLPLEAPQRTKRRFALRIPKKRAKHCAIYGCAMLGVYLFTGFWTYLAAALILLALTSLSFRRPAASPV